MQKWDYCVQGQGHSKGLYNHNMTIFTLSFKLLVHLQPNSVGSTALQTGVYCGKIILLRSRSRTQQRFKMSVNVCLDDIF